MMQLHCLISNNSVPQYIYDEDIKGKYDYKLTDTFYGDSIVEILLHARCVIPELLNIS